MACQSRIVGVILEVKCYLHEIETHGDQGHAQHEIHGAEDEAQLEPLLCRVDFVAGNEVTETDGA